MPFITSNGLKTTYLGLNNTDLNITCYKGHLYALSYYDEKNFTEWMHPIAGTNLVKARHAEYETFMCSTHQSAGVACADCHMPYTMVGNKKISSHNWQSSLNNIEQSCITCYRNGTDWLKNRVYLVYIGFIFC